MNKKANTNRLTYQLVAEVKEVQKCGCGFFRTLFVWGNWEVATFYFPITSLGVSEVYGTAGAAIQTEVWLKVVITPLLGAVVFALLI